MPPCPLRAFFPDMSAPPTDAPVHEVKLVVRSYELDSFDHVNHAVFLHYLEHARFQTLRAGGFPKEEMARKGWGVYVVRIEVDYLKEAREGDELTVQTWAEGFRRTSMVLGQRILRGGDPDDQLLAALVTAVWIGENGRPMRVPDEVRSAFGVAP